MLAREQVKWDVTTARTTQPRPWSLWTFNYSRTSYDKRVFQYFEEGRETICWSLSEPDCKVSVVRRHNSRMKTEEHVGLGIAYSGFGGPSPRNHRGRKDETSPPTTPRTPRSPRSPKSSSPPTKSRRDCCQGQLQVEARTTAGANPYPQYWRFSIWLCLLVLAVSAMASYLLYKHPFFVELGIKRLGWSWDFSALMKKWCGQSGVVNGLMGSDGLWKPRAFTNSLLWMAPFLSGGGYCSEAISYVSAIEATKMVQKLKISQHGDLHSKSFWTGLPLKTREMLLSLLLGDVDLEDSIVVCHSEPGAWYPPLFQTPQCPPTGYDEPLYVIGRTMFETDSVTADHVNRCNKMDEIWVPTQFHVDTFTEAGVEPEKLVKLVQAVDTQFFNPAKVKPLPYLAGKRVLVSEMKMLHTKPPYVFLSIFKWEFRKGWDILLSAYLQEFSGKDNVALYLLTNPYHSKDQNFASIIQNFVCSVGISEPDSGWPIVYVISQHIPQVDLPRLYKAADCFVLPSRGEGWGRPHVEAMAMELPVIATNWSGMTEYMTDRNSYLLSLRGMTEVPDGPFKGHSWADPSTLHLMSLMRTVSVHPEEAKKKGKIARKDMLTNYSPEVVAQVVLDQLARIQDKLQTKNEITASED